TFFMTIFGTFLTRSGAIASVHSFAQSSIGAYFVYFLIALAAVVLTLILYRWPELRGFAPSMQLRRAALATGWAMVSIAAPGCVAISRLQLPEVYRALLIAGAAGGAVFVGVELIFRRLTQGLDLRPARPEIESTFSREFTF